MHLALFTWLFLLVHLPSKVALLKVVECGFCGEAKVTEGELETSEPWKQGAWAGENVFWEVW